jgi:hypothetical protein
MVRYRTRHRSDAHHGLAFRRTGISTDWHFDVDDPITPGRFMDHDACRRTVFHRDHVAPRGWFDSVTIALEQSATQVFRFGFPRSPQQGYFEASACTLLRLLAPHVRRATILGGWLGTTWHG